MGRTTHTATVDSVGKNCAVAIHSSGTRREVLVVLEMEKRGDLDPAYSFFRAGFFSVSLTRNFYSLLLARDARHSVEQRLNSQHCQENRPITAGEAAKNRTLQY